MKNILLSLFILFLSINTCSSANFNYWSDGTIHSIGNQNVSTWSNGQIRKIGDKPVKYW